MRTMTTNPAAEPNLVFYKRCVIDLATGVSCVKEVPCLNLEDVLGGFGRSATPTLMPTL